jgi:hypothetical protein
MKLSDVDIGGAMDGNPEVEEKVKLTRFEICQVCENLVKDKCKLCGCWMPLKARIPLTKCPIGKW